MVMNFTRGPHHMPMFNNMLLYIRADGTPSSDRRWTMPKFSTSDLHHKIITNTRISSLYYYYIPLYLYATRSVSWSAHAYAIITHECDLRVRTFVCTYLLYCFRVYIVSDGNVKIILLLLTVYTYIGKKIKPSMPRVVLIIFFLRLETPRCA